MPTTLIDLTSDAATRITMQWREPYLTEAINKKMSAVVPQGVHRGWRLGLIGTEPSLTVSILADPVTQDHVLVQRSLEGDSVTIRGTYYPGKALYLGGVGIPGTTVVVAVFANYTVGIDTTAAIRVYTEAEWLGMTPQQQSSVVALGKVVVPMSGPIHAENITPDYRSMAWETIGSDALPWEQLVRNGGFETAPVGTVTATMVDGWDLVQTSTGEWEVGTFPAAYAHGLAFHSGTGPSQGLATQVLHTPCRPGQRVKLHFSYQTTAVASVGTARVYVTFEDLSGAVISVVSGPALLDSVGPAAQVVEAVLDAPAQCNRIGRVAIECSGVTALVDSVIFFDDIRVLLDPANAQCSNQDASSTGAPISTAGLTLEGPDSRIGDLAALLTFNQDSPVGEGQLKVARKDGGIGSAPMLNLLGRIMAGSSALGTDAHARLPRLATAYKADASSGFGYTLLWEALATTGAHPGVRLYAGAAGGTDLHAGMYLSTNCYWDGTNWNKDLVGSNASLFSLSTATSQIRSRAAAANTPWTDAAWSTTPLEVGANYIYAKDSTVSAGSNLVVGQDSYASPETKVEVDFTTAGGNLVTALRGKDADHKSDFTITHSADSVMLTFNAVVTGGTTWNYTNPSDSRAIQLEMKATGWSIRYYGGADGWINTAWTSICSVSSLTAATLGTATLARGLRLGDGYAAPRADTTPRVAAKYAADADYFSPKYTLILELTSDLVAAASQSPVRLYAVWDGGLIATLNANYNSATHLWYNDLAGVEHIPMCMVLSGSGIGGFVGTKLLFRDPALVVGGTWTDSGWRSMHAVTVTEESKTIDTNTPRAFCTFNDGTISFPNATDTASDRTNPSATVPIRNELRAKNTPKAWAHVAYVWDGNPALWLRDGFNVASVTYSLSRLIVTFARPMVHDQYAIIPTSPYTASSSYVVPVVESQTAAGFVLAFWGLLAGSILNISGLNVTVDFTVFGKQN